MSREGGRQTDRETEREKHRETQRDRESVCVLGGGGGGAWKASVEEGEAEIPRHVLGFQLCFSLKM